MKWDCKVMMKKSVLLFLLGFGSFIGTAQIGDNIFFKEFVDATNKSQAATIWLQGNANFGSSAIDNSFALKMGLGGHIGSEEIKKIYDKMDEMPRAKANLNYSLTYWGNDILNGKGLGLYASIGSRVYGQSEFNKDVFGILFRGNVPYAGTNLDLSNSNAQLIQYMKYTIGLHKENLDATTGNLMNYYGGGLSYIQGVDYIDFNTQKANLFTETDGQYVELDLQYSLQRASRPKGFTNPNGGGLALDAFYGAVTSKLFWEVSVSDFGMVKFKDAVLFEKDTTGVRFEGQDLNGNGGSLSDVLDSLVRIVSSNESVGDKTVFLPAVFRVRAGVELTNGLELDALLVHVLAKENLPLVQVRGTKRRENLSYGVFVAYGGYEKSPMLGIHGGMNLFNRFTVQGNLGGLETFVASKTFQGLQVNLGLGVSLR